MYKQTIIVKLSALSHLSRITLPTAFKLLIWSDQSRVNSCWFMTLWGQLYLYKVKVYTSVLTISLGWRMIGYTVDDK